MLIISPHFPPLNTADMHRVRQSLPYFRSYNWIAEIVTVDPAFVESYSTDNFLLKTIPADIKVHKVKAWDAKKTRRFGLGSLSMRSFFHFLKKGNELLRTGNFDLVYFSTTAFHVMALGPYWKSKFKVPFIVDIQDPWRNDYYLKVPKNQRSRKFVIAYNIDKNLEAFTIPRADGIISVSEAYLKTFRERYKSASLIPSRVIPFAGATIDFEVMEKYVKSSPKVEFDKRYFNIIYIGRGGYDMEYSIRAFFLALKKFIDDNVLTKSIKCWFIGTSYAIEGKGVKTIQPVAEALGLVNCVTEITDRIPYFETLFLMRQADLLFVPGSVDEGYTASKIYPYLLAKKPLLAIFNENSSVVDIIRKIGGGIVVPFSNNDEDIHQLTDKVVLALRNLVEKREYDKFSESGFYQYSAENMTREQVDLFNLIAKDSQ